MTILFCQFRISSLSAYQPTIMKQNLSFSTYPFFELNGKKVQLVTTLYVDNDKKPNLDNDGIDFTDDFQKIMNNMIESDLVLPYGSRTKTRISKDRKIHHLGVLRAMETQIKAQIAKIEKMESQ